MDNRRSSHTTWSMGKCLLPLALLFYVFGFPGYVGDFLPSYPVVVPTEWVMTYDHHQTPDLFHSTPATVTSGRLAPSILPPPRPALLTRHHSRLARLRLRTTPVFSIPPGVFPGRPHQKTIPRSSDQDPFSSYPG